MKQIVVLELGQNHNGDMRNVGKFLYYVNRLKKEYGDKYDFVPKFQLYNTDAIFTGKEDFYVDTLNAELTLSQMRFVARECKKYNLPFFSSVFDEERLDWYSGEDVWGYKVASRSAMDKNLLDVIVWEMVNKGADLPVVISFGMKHEKALYYREIYKKCYILYCKSEYPTIYTKKNTKYFLRNIGKVFDGISDHSVGVGMLETALRNSKVKMVEKHFTLDKEMSGPDHALSATIDDLRCMFRRLSKKGR